MVVAFGPPIWGGLISGPYPKFTIPERKNSPQKLDDHPLYEEQFVSPLNHTPRAHSPSITQMANGHLLAVWYAGSGEKEPDIVLYQASYDPNTRAWAKPRLLTDPKGSQAELGRYIYTLGNPTLFTDPVGKIWLFYVTRWIGGWSSSSLNLKISEDNGASWAPARRLGTNPYWNNGTLVRTHPFLYEDGSIGLPAYHELMGVFPEMYRISPEGKLLGKTRIFYEGSSLQPSVVPLDQNRGIALIRNKRSGGKNAATQEKKTLISKTVDMGQHWSTPEALELPNPNSSVAGLRLTDGSILAAFNNTPKGRGNLALARSLDQGQHWTVITTIEEGKNLSYPSLIQSNDGAIHLVYTWNRIRIKHIMFNKSWMKRQLG